LESVVNGFLTEAIPPPPHPPLPKIC